MRGCKFWKPRIVGIDRPDEAARQILYFMEVIMSRKLKTIELSRQRRQSGIACVGYISDIENLVSKTNQAFSKMMSDIKYRISNLKGAISGKPGMDLPITDDEVLDELNDIYTMISIMERGDMEDFEAIQTTFNGKWNIQDNARADDVS